MQSATFRARRGIVWARALAARAPGWRFVVDKPPLLPVRESFANLVPSVGAETCGVLYEITADDMAHVDLTEGVLIGNYRRIEIAVEPLARVRTQVRAFTLVSDQRALDLRPTTAYMARVIEGALEHGLPAAWIAFLRTVPTAAESAEAADVRAFMDEALARLRRP